MVALMMGSLGPLLLVLVYAVETAVTQSCTVTDNRIIGKGSTAHFWNITSAAECCAKCGHTEGCRAFTWTKAFAIHPSGCWLKDNVEVGVMDNGTISGTPKHSPVPPKDNCAPPPVKPYPPAASLPRCKEFPDPFMLASGKRVSSFSDWQSHRQDMISLLEHYMMGHSPPRNIIGSQLNGSHQVSEVCDRTGCVPAAATLRNYSLSVGPNASMTSQFNLFLYVPLKSSHNRSTFPVFVYSAEGYFGGEGYGDLTAQGLSVLLSRGYAVASFDRDQLRCDHKTDGQPDGVQLLYPEYDWGTLAVWAWGAATVTDFLLGDPTLAKMIDPKKVMSMGHSRGGKTALWHAVNDRRVSIVFPLMSGCGGCGALRVSTPFPNHPQPGDCELAKYGPCSETVASIMSTFPYWFNPRYGEFAGAESAAPWDQHWQRMLVAPTPQLSVEGITNYHENPVGSQATYVATKVIYDWMEVPDKLGIYFHPGKHPMNDMPGEHDWQIVADFADKIHFSVQPKNASLFNTTAYPIDAPFSWGPPIHN